MKIYTKRGDSGETDLFGGGKRIKKNALRIHVIGDVDELNAQVGVIRSLKPDRKIETIIIMIQHVLFALGADLATLLTAPLKVERIKLTETEQLEREIDALEAELTPLTAFILPGGTVIAAQLHLARVVCRRAERSVVSLAEKEGINPEIIKYLNRLSDLLFVLARYANKQAGEEDVLWKKGRESV